jgi:very-short-patch-repair endonuclease
MDDRTHRIVIGQKVDAEKIQRAKQFRREMTGAEKKLWQCLRANRLNGLHFRRQQVIDGFIVDFYCHRAGLVVEVDGGVHQQQVEYDQERSRVLETRGLRVLRIGNEDVANDLEGVLRQIAMACEGT